MRRPLATRGAALLFAGPAATAGLGLVVACGSTEAPPAPEQDLLFDEALGDDVVPLVSFHTRYGFPGPWSKEGGHAGEFDRESRTCLGRSNEARREAPEGQRNEAAYSGFLDCMQELGWTRGTTAKKDAESTAEEPAVDASS